jgi:hypothetical protein
MNKLPQDRMLREQYRAIEKKHPFIRPGHANPKEALDKIGEKLVEILALNERARKLEIELFLRYLFACEAHGHDAKPYRTPRAVWGSVPPETS